MSPGPHACPPEAPGATSPFSCAETLAGAVTCCTALPAPLYLSGELELWFEEAEVLVSVILGRNPSGRVTPELWHPPLQLVSWTSCQPGSPAVRCSWPGALAPALSQIYSSA